MDKERNEAGASAHADQTKLLTYAVLTGLTPLIPVPLLDDATKGYLRRRMVRKLAAAYGRALSREELDALTTEQRSGCFGGCLGTLIFYPLKKIFRKVFFFLEWKRAVDLTSRTYHFGHLIGYALQPRAGAASLLDLYGAAKVGASIEAVCREAPIKPVETAVGGTFRGSKRILRASAVLLGQSVRRLTGRAERESATAHDAAPVELPEEREVAPVVARLQKSLSSVPEEHFGHLRSMLDARLRTPDER